MYADHLLKPWTDRILTDLPGAAVFDCHTHVGGHDPSGFTATVEELEQSVAITGGRAAVFSMAEPEGYADANRRCTDAADSSGGRLVALTRLTPTQHPAEMLAEGLAAGARGVKLHGASDEFDLDDARLEPVYRQCDAERLPVIVHAGPELEDVGRSALRICHRYPGLQLVLAHCGLTDLGWIWREVPRTPNLYFDTSWWVPAHLIALFKLVPPGRILLASDLPYSTPLSAALATLRCGWQAGLGPEQLSGVAGSQWERLVSAEPAADLGPPPGEERRRPGPMLEILSSVLLPAVEGLQRGESPGDPLTLARRACDVPDDDPDADVIASVARLIKLYDEHHQQLPHGTPHAPGRDLILAAMLLARTPAAPLPTPP